MKLWERQRMRGIHGSSTYMGEGHIEKGFKKCDEEVKVLVKVRK